MEIYQSLEYQSLDNDFNSTIQEINQHTKNLGNVYCECKQCYINRQKLTELGHKMKVLRKEKY